MLLPSFVYDIDDQPRSWPGKKPLDKFNHSVGPVAPAFTSAAADAAVKSHISAPAHIGISSISGSEPALYAVGSWILMVFPA